MTEHPAKMPRRFCLWVRDFVTLIALARLLGSAPLNVVVPAAEPSRIPGGQAVQAGFTSTEIRLGMSAPFTQGTRALGIELYRGSMACFLKVNEKGTDGSGRNPGIHGRKIIIKAYDDRYEPDPAIKNTLGLMSQDNIFTLINYVGTPTMNRTLPLLAKNKDSSFYLFFPFTGAGTNRRPPYDRYSFNFRASYAQETRGLVEHFLRINRGRIAVFFQADAYGRSGWAGVVDAINLWNASQSAGGSHAELCGEATYKRGAPYGDSYQRQVALIEESAPDAIIAVGAYPACAGFIRDYRNRGLDTPIANLSFVGSEAMLELLLAEEKMSGKSYTRGLINSQVVPSYADDQVPAVRDYRKAMLEYAGDLMPPQELLGKNDQKVSAYKAPPFSFASFEGFLNARLMVKILDELGPVPERRRINEVVASLKQINIGLTETVSFGPDKHQGSDQVYYTVVRDNQFATLDEAGWNNWLKP